MPKPRQPANTTAMQLMDAAERRMREAGYHGFSFRDIAADVGIKSSSAHHHFRTKRDLVCAVVNRYTERMLNEARTFEGGLVAGYIAAFRSTIVSEGRMCLGGILGAETGALPQEVADAMRAFFSRCVETLAESMPDPETAVDEAVRIMATLQGAVLMAHAFDDVSAFDRATSALRRRAGLRVQPQFFAAVREN